MNEKDVLHKQEPQSLPVMNLDDMSDEEIKTLIADGYKLLDRRKREQERKVRERIKQLADDAGIKVSFRERTERRKRNS